MENGVFALLDAPFFHNIFQILVHDISKVIFKNNIEKFKKKLSLVLNIFEIMENGAFAPKEQMLHFQ